MTAKPCNVLLFEKLPTQEDCRKAISKIIRSIQLEFDETDIQTAGKLGISVGTVRNARNKTTDLSALTIAKIGTVYGEHQVNPYSRLFGAALYPLHSSEDVDVTTLTALIHQIISSGPRLQHNHILKMQPELRAAQRTVTHLLSRAAELEAA